jgi:hypothetical protein
MQLRLLHLNVQYAGGRIYKDIRKVYTLNITILAINLKWKYSHLILRKKFPLNMWMDVVRRILSLTPQAEVLGDHFTLYYELKNDYLLFTGINLSDYHCVFFRSNTWVGNDDYG